MALQCMIERMQETKRCLATTIGVSSVGPIVHYDDVACSYDGISRGEYLEVSGFILMSSHTSITNTKDYYNGLFGNWPVMVDDDRCSRRC